MKFAHLITLILALFTAIAAQSDIKIKHSIEPVFPPEASSYLYGDSMKVAVEVDTAGKVTKAIPIGPMAPCSNLQDKLIDTIVKAAVDAASATTFEPFLKNGQPSVFNMMLTYRLTPKMIETESKPGDIFKRVKSLPKPFFTSEARTNHIGGQVELSVLVDEQGRVISLAPISGHPALVAGTLNAACNARFDPPLVNGQPIKISGKLTYKFVP